ncbi:MAG TPA: DUF2630 family protein [Mycobacteriales bacterium]|jgi:hypothetical protein|nr:DUF2630 family protein [Mycobacteriales bacterium]
MTSDADILSQIKALVDEEHALSTGSENHERRQHIEEHLDQCWDLLRQRQARREFGQNPDDASARPVKEVEGYIQ